MPDVPWENPEVPPKAIDRTNSLSFLRFVDPTDPTKLIQLDIVDTGKVTSDGLKIYSIGVTGSGGGSTSGIQIAFKDELGVVTDAKGSALGYLFTTLKGIYRWFKSPPGVYQDNAATMYCTQRIVGPRRLDKEGGFEFAAPVSRAATELGIAAEEESIELDSDEAIQFADIDASFSSEICGGIYSTCDAWELDIYCYNGTIFGGYRITLWEHTAGTMPVGASDEIIPFYVKPNGQMFLLVFTNKGTGTATDITVVINRRG